MAFGNTLFFVNFALESVRSSHAFPLDLGRLPTRKRKKWRHFSFAFASSQLFNTDNDKSQLGRAGGSAPKSTP